MKVSLVVAGVLLARRTTSPLGHMCPCLCRQQTPRVRCRLFQQLRDGVMSPTLTVPTVPWGFPCTVTADTYLFPDGLDMGLDDIELAATTGIKTCFLCTRVGMSPASAARFAKQLEAGWIFSVGDFLALAHEECMAALPRADVTRLDKFIKGCPDLPEHAAPGTRGGCEMSLYYRLMWNMRLLTQD